MVRIFAIIAFAQFDFQNHIKKYFLPKQNCRPKFIALNGSLFIIKLMIFPLVAGKLHICHVLSIRHYVKP